MWSIGYGPKSVFSSSSDSTTPDSVWADRNKETKVPPQEDAINKWPFAIQIPDAAFQYCNRSNSVPNLGATHGEKAAHWSSSEGSSESSSGRTSLHISHHGPPFSALFNNTHNTDNTIPAIDYDCNNNRNNINGNNNSGDNNSNLALSTDSGSSDWCLFCVNSYTLPEVNTHWRMMDFSENKDTQDNGKRDRSSVNFLGGGQSGNGSEERQKDGFFGFASARAFHNRDNRGDVDCGSVATSVAGLSCLANPTETENHRQRYEADPQRGEEKCCGNCRIQ